jgi:hypothetical protein
VEDVNGNDLDFAKPNPVDHDPLVEAWNPADERKENGTKTMFEKEREPAGQDGDPDFWVPDPVDNDTNITEIDPDLKREGTRQLPNALPNRGVELL